MNPTKPPRALTWIAACCAASLMAAPAAATTYVMMADQDLADQTPVIAVVRVSAIEPSSEAGAPATDYVARVERAVKGAITGSVRVRVPLSAAALRRVKNHRFSLTLTAKWSDGAGNSAQVTQTGVSLRR